MKFTLKEDGKRIVTIILASMLMAINIKTFVRIGALYPGGATGLTILVQNVFERFFNMKVPYTLVNLLLNAFPVYIGFKFIGKKFTLYSCFVIVLTSIFTDLIPGFNITSDILLISIFGGMINGLAISICLRMNATTGGTDFIALYVSTKTGNEIWMQVFAFNCVQLVIFGALSGWEQAGYSILFQFISTRMISTFHSRYKRVMLQIITREKDKVVKAYLKHFSHGITVLCGTGGYTGKETWVLLAVTSSYEMSEAIELIRKVDPSSIINVTKSEKLIGKFQQPSL